MNIPEQETKEDIKTVYLDNSATTKPYKEVVEKMNVLLTEKYGNPSSLHRMGLEAEKEVRKSREIIAESLGVQPVEIYFTSGGTEANNLAILGYVTANRRRGRHLITTSIEHPSVLNTFKYLEEQGYEVDYLAPDERGFVSPEKLQDKLREDTLLVSIMMVNNEVGTIQPIQEFAKSIGTFYNGAKNRPVFHVDAVQAYGKLSINPISLGADMMTISAHKIHGPKGAGALYVRKGIRIHPILLGGGQESAVRSGTENVPGICGFGKAAEICFKQRKEKMEYVRSLREHLREALGKIPDTWINTPEGDAAAPHILNVSFAGVRAEVLLHTLESSGIYVSTGSACSSRKKAYSHVLTAMCLEPGRLEGAIRISLSEMNTLEEILYAEEVLTRSVVKLRRK